MESHPTIPQALRVLDERFSPQPLPAGGSPVFLFAGAWRSGSTLVQRLLVSSGTLLVWGEPYDHSALVRRLSESLLPISEKWPPDNYIADRGNPPTAERWIANAYPHPSDLLAAHRAFFDRLFDTPARDLGYERWGIKGVRLSGEHAVYLRRIYPDARFVFLHRNPYDAFLSYRLLHEIRPHSYWWYHRWPDEQVSTASHFGEIWARLTGSFLKWAPEVKAAVIAYEDVTTGAALDDLAGVTGVEIDRAVLDRRVGGTAQQKGRWRGAKRELTDEELADLQGVVDEIAAGLGYDGPSGGSK
jgi:hypothetical protein